MLFGPLIFIVLIVLIVNFFNGGTGWNNRATGQMDHRSAVDILDERLARGDIDRREYDQKKRVLEQN